MSGIFGVVSEKDCLDDLFYGTDYHSHLGTEYGGLAVLGEEGFYRQIHNIGQSQFKSKFHEDYRRMKGNKGIGVISACEEQPIYLNSKLGPFAIATNGFIENSRQLTKDLLEKGVSFAEVSRGEVNITELTAKLINQSEDLVTGIERMFDLINGSCSLLLLHEDGIYAARDKYGYSPLVIGKKPGAWAVTSETSAFHNLDFEIVKYLKAGEIVLITGEGLKQINTVKGITQICTFLWIYTGFPASNYEGINAEVTREKCGRLLAKRDKDIEVDMVAGVPDSGIAHALGYAMESGRPYRRPLIKYTPGYGRSYTPSSQKTRDLVAKMKLVPVKEIIEGERIVVCDDSIVRGTQLKNFTIKKLNDCGAREIHIRPACPPLLFPCKFNISTRSIDELIARKAIRGLEGHDIDDISKYVDSATVEHQNMIAWIARSLGVTTLRYQTVEDMIEAVGLPKEKLCLYCWTGKCPQKDVCLEKQEVKLG